MSCPVCGNEMREIPAGVSSRTGKPYKAFLACSTQGCDGGKSKKGSSGPITRPSRTPQGGLNVSMYSAYGEHIAVAIGAAYVAQGRELDNTYQYAVDQATDAACRSAKMQYESAKTIK